MATANLYKASEIIKESMPILFAVLFFSLVTGNNLETASEFILVKAVFILIVLPAFMNMEGDLAAVFVSKITSHLYVGTLDTRFRPRRVFLTDLLSITVVAGFGFIFLGVVTMLLYQLFSAVTVNGLTLVFIIVLTGLLTTLVMCGAGVLVAYATFRRGLHPGNYAPPLLTTMGDALGTFLLIVFLKTLLFS